MFAKGAVTILAIGATACMLLTLRQQRLNAVHEIAILQRRLSEHDRTFLKLRTEIAARITPDRIRELSGHFGHMVPIGLQHWWAAVEAERLAAEAGEAAEQTDDSDSDAEVRRISTHATPDDDE